MVATSERCCMSVKVNKSLIELECEGNGLFSSLVFDMQHTESMFLLSATCHR